MGTVEDVGGTTESPPDPTKYALADTTGRGRTRALTASQAEGRGFESPFPLHTQSLAAQGVPHDLLQPLSTRSQAFCYSLLIRESGSRPRSRSAKRSSPRSVSKMTSV